MNLMEGSRFDKATYRADVACGCEAGCRWYGEHFPGMLEFGSQPEATDHWQCNYQ